MKNLCIKSTIGGCLLFLVAPLAISKLPLSSLRISGGKLSQPIEVTDPKLLRASNPWWGTFIPQWNVVPRQDVFCPPETASRYEISFYAASLPNNSPRLVYIAYYTFDAATHCGFLYLPGQHEEGYRTNAASILRPNQDGRWNLADPVWCDRINASISGFTRTRSH